MLTLRHVEKNGYESVQQVASVSLEMPAEHNEYHPTLNRHNENGQVLDGGYGDGKVYVMNENGKTVAVYDLDELQLAAKISKEKKK